MSNCESKRGEGEKDKGKTRARVIREREKESEDREWNRLLQIKMISRFGLNLTSC